MRRLLRLGIAAAVVLLPLVDMLSRLGAWGLSAVLATAIVWSASPIAQFGRNRCHRLVPIYPFGAARIHDSLAQGVITGAPCALACWPWMIAPMLVHNWMPAATFLAALILFLDRLEPPTRCRWRVPPWLWALRQRAAPQKVVGRP
jgi:hypothetical protein